MRYELEDWIVFIADGKDTSKLRDLQRSFESRVYTLGLRALGNNYEPESNGMVIPRMYTKMIDGEGGEPDIYHEDAYLAYSSLAGDGVGLWEDRAKHHKVLQGAVLADTKLRRLYERIEDEIDKSRRGVR